MIIDQINRKLNCLSFYCKVKAKHLYQFLLKIIINRYLLINLILGIGNLCSNVYIWDIASINKKVNGY